MDQGLVLDLVVGRLVVELLDVLQVVTLGRDEQDTYTCAFKVLGAIEIHLPVLRLLRRWGLLGLCPLGDKIGEDLGLDGLSWVELEVEIA
jgi:hypothetical protein